MPYTFDGDNLLIIMTAGTTEVDATTLYSDWKDWQLVNDNSKYFEAFRTIGGDPLGGALEAGDYYFLRNDYGWRIRPQEADHDLQINGNLYGEDPALPLFIPTIGNFTVLVKQQLSSLTQTVNDSQFASAILDEPNAIETGITMRQALRLILAATAGKVSGADTTTVTIRNASADTKNRIVATVDSNGNRTAVVYDVTD